MLTLDQKGAVLREVERLIEKANVRYAEHANMEMPHVSFDLRGTTGGMAYPGRWEINLNAALMVDNWDHYMSDTIPHEVAHLVVHRLWGTETRRTRTGKVQRISHGDKWKSVMRMCFNVEPKRCHQMDVSKTRQAKRPQTKHQYRCNCCGAMVPVGPKHHKKLQNGAALRHRCVTTGPQYHGRHGTLEYTGVLGRVTWQEAAQTKAAPKAAPRATAPAAGTQIARAVDILKQCRLQGIDTRQGAIKQIMALMGVNKDKASGLHDRAKKKV